jgi:hypothetical protein
MALTKTEVADLKKKIKEHVDNYPDVDALVAAGRLIRKAGWYEAMDKEAFDAIAPYATGFRQLKNGKGQVKISKPTKRLKAQAAKL